MKNIFFITSFLISITNVFSQQGLPFYNHYLVSDKMLINPSYAGQDLEVISINGTYRNQWDNLPNSPNTQTLSMHGVIVDRLALGAYFFNDVNGAVKLTGYNLTAAYHIPFDDFQDENNIFSFGIGASNVSQRFDFSKIKADDYADPALLTDYYNTFFLNLGLSAKYRDFFFGVSVIDISLKENKYFINNVEPYPVWYYFNLGYNWRVAEGIVIEPSIVYNSNSNTSSNLDINLLANLGREDSDNLISFGVSYKQGLGGYGQNPLFISPILKAKIGTIKAGISYDIGLSNFDIYGKQQGVLFSLGLDLQNPWGAIYR